MDVTMVYTRMRVEEKMIQQELERKGARVSTLADAELVFPSASYPANVLVRSMSSSRANYISFMLEPHVHTMVNSFNTLSICSDKIMTTETLARHNVPVVPATIAFGIDGALDAMESMGYPVVLKPAVGSHGNLVSKINDRDAAEALLEHKGHLQNPMHSVFYLQKFIDSGNSDIRAGVIGSKLAYAMLRSSEHWITNVAKGGHTSAIDADAELEAICLAAAKAVGGGIVGIDLFKTNEDYMVNEINPVMEFQGAMQAGLNPAADIANYLVEVMT